jgi:hypothetical protein
MVSLSVPDNPDHGPNGRFDGGSPFADVRAAEFPAVAAVTVAVAADAPLSATELGESFVSFVDIRGVGSREAARGRRFRGKRTVAPGISSALHASRHPEA